MQEVTWPTPSGVNFITAKLFCEQAVTLTTYAAACFGLENIKIEFDESVLDCTSDIQVWCWFIHVVDSSLTDNVQ